MAAVAILPYPSSASGSGATIRYPAYHYSPQHTMSSRYPSLERSPSEDSSSNSLPRLPRPSTSHLEEPVADVTAITDTPMTMKPSSRADSHSGSIIKANDPDDLLLWSAQFRKHHSCSPLEIMEFIETYVPAKPGCPKLKKGLEHVFDDVKPGNEQEMYKPLINGANRLAKFAKNTTMRFVGTDLTKVLAVHESQHHTKPDLSATLPGENVPLTWSYDRIGHIWEVKGKSSEDPINAKGECTVSGPCDAWLTQLSKYGRNILLSHMSCYSFVVGVYGDIMRIFRFDHAAVISSQPFEYKKSPDIVHKFLWHLAHPIHGVPHTVCGSDPTIRQPNAKDREKMYEAVLAHASDINSLYRENAEEKLKASFRWIDVYWDPLVLALPGHINEVEEPGSESTSDPNTDNGEESKPKQKLVTVFAFGPALSSSSGLFSRATQVLNVMFLEHPGTVYVLKDAWRERCRHPEGLFYARIQRRIKEYQNKDEMETGLATCIGAFDFGDEIDADDLGYVTQSARLLKSKEDTEHLLADHPIDRNRMRSLTSTVGKRLTKYTSTKQLVHALRCAIRGHELARKCGVLHRDISEGNVLLRMDGKGGFLHDFDYSCIVVTADDDIRPDELKKIAEELKTKTGTQQFLALGSLAKPRELHGEHHDLESFYWVLIWILLRHASHDHPDGNRACTLLFDWTNTSIAWSCKHTFLTAQRLQIVGNAPLTALLFELRGLLVQQVRTAYNDGTPVTHAAMLDTIDHALQQPGWPENDAANPYERPPPTDIEARNEQRESNKPAKKSLRAQALQAAKSASSGSGGRVEELPIPTASGSSKRKREQPSRAASAKSRKASSSSRPRREHEDE